MKKKSKYVSFDENALLPALFGEDDQHLSKLEEDLNVIISSRGNVVSITGSEAQVDIAEYILGSLYTKLQSGTEININEIDAALRMSKKTSDKQPKQLFDEEIVLRTPKKHISPRSNNQKEYIKALFKHDMVFASGPAGTGKTYLAVAAAISSLTSHKIERIVLVRPAVEAGEKIGFLPGDMKEKIDPYMQPLYDALFDMLPAEKVHKHIENRVIEIVPLAFMRGRTLRDSFVILDEAQNATTMQMKMFLTRLGENSRMVINGDLSQVDLPSSVQSGFDDAINKLRDIKEIGNVQFEAADIVRHSLVAKIVNAYNG